MIPLSRMWGCFRQGSHRDWKKKMVMEKSRNVTNHQEIKDCSGKFAQNATNSKSIGEVVMEN